MSFSRTFEAKKLYSYLSVRSEGSHLKLSVRVPSEGGEQTQKAVLSCANTLRLPFTEEWQAEDSEVVHDLSYDQASHSIKPSLMEVRQALQSMLKATRLPEVKGHLKMLSKMVEATIYTWCIQAGSIADHSAAKTEGSTAAEKHLFHTQKFRAAALLLDAFTVFSGMYNDLHAAQKDWGISRVDSERALVELGIRVSQLRQQTRQEWDTLTSLGAKPRYLTRLPTETVLKLRREMLALRGDNAELAAKTMLEEALASAERDQTYLNSACVRQAIPMNESQDATSADRDDDERSEGIPSKLEDASFVLIQIDNDRKLHIDDSQLRGAEKKNAHSFSSRTKLPLSSAVPKANVTLGTDHDDLGFHAYLDAWKRIEPSALVALSSLVLTTPWVNDKALLCRIGYNTATKTIAQVRGRLSEDPVDQEATNEATDLLDKMIVKKRKQLLVETIATCKEMVNWTSKALYELTATRLPPCYPVDDKLIQATKKDLTLLSAQIKQIAAAGGVSLDDLERLSPQNLSDIATLTSRLAHNKSQAWEKLLSLSAAPETIQDALDRFKKRKPKPRHKPKKKAALPSTVPGIDTDNATEGESHAPRVDDIQASVDRPDTGMQDTTPVGLPDEMHLDSDSESPDGSEVERESSVTSESVAYDANDSLLCGEQANGTPCTEPTTNGRERPLSLAHIPVAIPALPILFKEQYPDTCRGRFPTGTEPRFFQCQSVLFPSNSVGRLRRAASVAELGTQEQTSILQDDQSHNDSEDDTWEDPYDHVHPTEEEQQWVDSIADRELGLPLVFDTLTGWQLVGELSGASASKKLLAEVKKRRAGEQT